MKVRKLLLPLLCSFALSSVNLMAWGRRIHVAITTAAYAALPAWQQDLWSDQRKTFINEYCVIPDLAESPKYAEFMPYIILPNGERFSHQPYRRRRGNAYQIEYYFRKAVEVLKAGDLDGASRYAGCLLHFLEDCGCPAHTIPGDNQLGLFKDLIPTPEQFVDRPLHGLVEEGDVNIGLRGYKPQLLGTTPAEAVFNLVERFDAMVRNARAQIIPILQGIFDNNQIQVDEGRRRAATLDAKVSADVLYTLLSIAKNHFDLQQVKMLNVRDLSSVTPIEVVDQSFFPQFSYFSNPYPGYPTRDVTLQQGTIRQPLHLNVFLHGHLTAETVVHGIGLGTYSRLTYALPEMVYDRFECLVGVQPQLGAHGAVLFRIYLDGDAVFDSGVMTGADPARKVVLRIWGVRHLSFSVENRSQSGDSNYAVIAQPRLFKAESLGPTNQVASVRRKGVEYLALRRN